MPRFAENIYNPVTCDLLACKGETVTPAVLECLRHVGYERIVTDVGTLYI